MITEDGKIKIMKFDESGFELWKMKTENCLHGKDSYLLFTTEKSNDMYDVDWKVLDGKTLRVVHLLLSCNVMFNIRKDTIQSL